jgi:hypothetical protein
MKKHSAWILCSRIFLAAFLVPTASYAAEVLSVQGSVQVQSSADGQWRKVEKGMQVIIGDLIRTARSSTVEIALDAEKKNTIRIEPRALVTLNSANAGIMDRLDLAKGKVYANLEDIKSGLTFEVNTPSAVAGVRGSALSVYVERDSDEIMAYKDTVFIKAYDVDTKLISESMLPEGFKTLIERFSEPGAYFQISQREFGSFDGAMDDLSSKLEAKTEAGARAEEARKEAPKEEEEDTQQQKVEDITEQANIVEQQVDVVQEFHETETEPEPDHTEEGPMVPEEPCVSCYIDGEGQLQCPPC